MRDQDKFVLKVWKHATNSIHWPHIRRRLTAVWSTNRPTNSLTHQSTNPLIERATNQTTNLPTHWPINGPTYQRTDQPNHRATTLPASNRPAEHLINQPNQRLNFGHVRGDQLWPAARQHSGQQCSHQAADWPTFQQTGQLSDQPTTWFGCRLGASTENNWKQFYLIHFFLPLFRFREDLFFAPTMFMNFLNFKRHAVIEHLLTVLFLCKLEG